MGDPRACRVCGGCLHCARTWEGLAGYADMVHAGALAGGAAHLPHMAAFFHATGLDLVGFRARPAGCGTGTAGLGRTLCAAREATGTALVYLAPLPNGTEPEGALQAVGTPAMLAAQAGGERSAALPRTHAACQLATTLGSNGPGPSVGATVVAVCYNPAQGVFHLAELGGHGGGELGCPYSGVVRGAAGAATVPSDVVLLLQRCE